MQKRLGLRLPLKMNPNVYLENLTSYLQTYNIEHKIFNSVFHTFKMIEVL